MAFGRAIRGMFESLGGPKMSDPRRLHNPEELKKWKARSDKSYDRYGTRRDMYEGRAQDEYGRYLTDSDEARRLYGRSESQAGAAQAGITSAAMRERRAGELADDRQHYAGLRERSMQRQKQREAYRLDLESQGSQPGSFDAVQAMVMDAAKMGNEAVMAQTEAVASGLAKTNPVAAAKLMMDAQSTAGTNLAKAKQQGWFAGQENRMKELQIDANRIMQQSGMLGQEEQADQIMAQAHQSRIADHMNLDTAGLNRSQANLALSSQYGATGDRFANLAGRSLQASQVYDQFGDAMSDRRTSIEEQRMGREQELMLSDQMAQQQVDEYNAGRMGRGIQTGLAIAGTAANLYSGIQAGRAASAEADMYSRFGRPDAVQPNRFATSFPSLEDQFATSGMQVGTTFVNNQANKVNPVNQNFNNNSQYGFVPNMYGAGPSVRGTDPMVSKQNFMKMQKPPQAFKGRWRKDELKYKAPRNTHMYR